MDIKFDDKKLEKLANDYKKCQRALGEKGAILFNKRLGDFRNASTLEDVRNLPGNYHELTANRKGQWSCDLNQPYRLIFTPQERPIPLNEDGQYIWTEITSVEVLEIIDYH